MFLSFPAATAFDGTGHMLVIDLAALCLSTATNWLVVDRPAQSDKTRDRGQACLGTHAAQTP
jgi:hypothetical protein